MKKLKLGLLLFATSLFLNGFAQLNNFDLSKYKLPDLKRRTLETNFNFHGDNIYEENANQNIARHNERKTNNYFGDIYLNYNYYLNNSKFQRTSSLYLNLSSNLNETKLDKKLLNKIRSISPELNYKFENRKYFKGNSFFEIDLMLDYKYIDDYKFSTQTTNNTTKIDELKTHTLLVLVPLKRGTGRIEPVQDARQAVYLFKELSKAGRMSAEMTDEQILECSKFISQLKNKRFFDTRLKRMAEIESLDSFLVANKYITKQDAKYFTTLTDFWVYGNGPNRKSGKRFSGVIIPGYYHYNYDNPGDGYYFEKGKYNLSSMLFDGGIEFKHEKPINLFWQSSINLNCFAGIYDGTLKKNSSSEGDKVRISNFKLGFFHTIGFYPTTRTNIRFNYSAQFVNLFDNANSRNGIISAEGKGAKASVGLIVNYYISPKFRINFNYSAYYIWQNSDDETVMRFTNDAMATDYLSNIIRSNNYTESYNEKKIYNNFRISLVYSIF